MNQRTLLETITEGFRKTPMETALNATIIIGIIVLIFLASLLNRLRIQSRVRKLWLNEYNLLIREKDLTINEINLLDILSKFLTDPFRKTLLLKNRNTFHKALSLWKKKSGEESVFAQSLIKKLFTEEQSILPEGFEKSFDIGRPARFIAMDGRTYSGQMTKRNGDIIILANVKKLENNAKSGQARLFVQDYRGIVSHSVSNVKNIDSDSLQLNLSSTGNLAEKYRLSLSEIYVYPDESGIPLKNSLKLLPKGLGIIKNTDQMFKVGQAVKVAFRKDSKEIYRVNAIVKSVSLNKQYATLKFGYLKIKQK
ncbi:MAG: hypothetical protein PF518_15765 [Spirochaetaceae bacterium]|jgi:hypothetical protein|nr:hypothetical protein [Spirochaetaceae bacterium]